MKPFDVPVGLNVSIVASISTHETSAERLPAARIVNRTRPTPARSGPTGFPAAVDERLGSPAAGASGVFAGGSCGSMDRLPEGRASDGRHRKRADRLREAMERA